LFSLTAARGPLLMAAATLAFVVSDTFMKLATADLPPFQVLAMRGLGAVLWCVPLLIATGQARNVPLAFHPRVLFRNGLELVAVLCFIVGLANLPIADITALGQVTPLFVLAGAALLFGERIAPVQWLLISLGLVGALLVAQPSAAGISVFALIGLLSAILAAGRDLATRAVPARIPGLIVAFSAIVVVFAGATAAGLSLERWLVPSLTSMALSLGAGFCVAVGHFCIFQAYRIGPTGAVAPFFYLFSVWAVLSGLAVFNQLPNWLAATGMLLIVLSGVTSVLVARRPTVTTQPA
jgi:drug/metabolite transporter (DMT)-like permease